MKKNRILIILISIIVLSILCYIGLFLSLFNYEFNVLFSLLFQLLGIIVVLPLFIAIHEAGHMVFGLISGYSLLSYKVGPFEWYKKEGKIAFRINPLSNIVLRQH